MGYLVMERIVIHVILLKRVGCVEDNRGRTGASEFRVGTRNWEGEH